MRADDGRAAGERGEDGGSRPASTTGRRGFLAALGAASATAGCLGAAGEPDPVTVGQPAALSGRWAHLQPGVTRATDLAVSRVDDAGGVLDRSLAVERLDTGVDPEAARETVQTLTDTLGAVALVGLFGNEIHENFAFLRRRRVPVVSPWASTAKLDGRGGDAGTPDDVDDDGWVWRTVVGDSIHPAGGAAKLLAAGARRLGVFHTTTPGESFWADTVATAFTNGGGQILTRERADPDADRDVLHTALHGVYQEPVDAWALGATREVTERMVEMWRQHDDMGGDLLLDDSRRTEAFLEDAGRAARGAWIATATGKGPGFPRFREAFEAAAGGPSDAGESPGRASEHDLHPWAVAAYDAVVLVALAAERAGEATPAAVQRNLGPVSRPGGRPVETFGDGKAALDAGEEVTYRGAASPASFTPWGNVLGAVRVEAVTPEGFRAVDRMGVEAVREVAGRY